MKVLVTGSEGFLGRHLVAALDGHDVVPVDIAATNPRDALDWFRGDDTSYDLVVHCAAVAPHRAAIDGRALAVGAGNGELDAAMFGWAARTRPGRVVYFSSSAAYPVSLQRGETEFSHPAWPSTMPRPLREDDIDLDAPEQPDAIYGAAKVMGERLARAYREQGGAVTVVRPFSGYGEDQSNNFPFGAFRDRAKSLADPFIVWGDGSQVRDWVHVDDVVGAVLAAVDQGVDGPVNICTGIGTSMMELAALFAREALYKPRLELHPEMPAGVSYRVGDPTLLNEFYTPRVSLAEGVKRALSS